MPTSKNYYLPDINVWIALCWDQHETHDLATEWFQRLSFEDRLYFCRVSQMGLLRLLTNSALMGDSVVTTRSAWEIVDAWSSRGFAEMLPEPAGIERDFRRVSYLHSGKGSHWTDSYLLAIARQHGLTLVTFDKALAKRSTGLLLRA